MTKAMEIFRGKRVLLTGHTGFKGGWLALGLQELGCTVSGYALAPDSSPNLFEILPGDLFERSWMADLRDLDTLQTAVRESQPDLIFHLAAQPIVGLSYDDPLGTFTTNALGTAHLLEAVRLENCPAAVVVVTSDKCYRNDNTGRSFIESDPLGGADVYSMSKASAELVVAAWQASFFAKSKTLGPLATGRAGNVIGGGDYAEDRIVPDAVRAYIHERGLQLRNPAATRPWQHVLESLSGYLALAKQLLQDPQRDQLLNFNFGPEPEAVRTVQDLVETWLDCWPQAFAYERRTLPTYAEAARLSLDISRAKERLAWRPVWDFRRTVAETAAWYRARHEEKRDAEAMLAFTRQQLRDYIKDARSASID